MELTQTQAQAWLASFATTILDHKAELNELDTAIGDGDHGTNMTRGVTQIQTVLQTSLPDLSTLLKQVAFAFISKVGGASGPLYGTAFLDMSNAAKQQSAELADLIQTGAAGIQRRGQAQVGDKTMLDVWQPVAQALAANQLTSQKIDTYLQATRDLVAKKGRASYLEERSRGHLDPGAQSSDYLFQTLLTVI
ncbi:Dihydroxyacetone kinase, L subunit [Bombilactobacillus mellifer]|uniref:phosphoenolpyruvate--glycerone phosphotransferase n=1 Tax=Bombilactobacillus mellifer TaxID=1218492 RepID=A0A0F4LTT8_9LACO|nr:dihydroxyacetone kinase subunit DhaL [Bombilactobacillus mellifer]KJY61714.1 Dihydroxyacetone kinase, L subunit [Bombilactobacillus mellifer]MCT6825795.1 dihydroxyacetone kinase subunit DhaL [Bombilactobacillus mellifer]MCT6844174.1 dihydroxyacetone kinase subunit DhaL [Bombilactobacillus mellifer]MCT6894937.1 dihydroxyacetone kinase subunit DhaL [Bombilactobacillus mellifer]